MRGKNECVVSAWLSRQYDRGHNHRSSLWFEGDVLYSYRTPIGFLLGSSAIVDNTRYSPTTSHHQSSAFSLAVAHLGYRNTVSLGFPLLERAGVDFRDLQVVAGAPWAWCGVTHIGLVATGLRSFLYLPYFPSNTRSAPTCLLELEGRFRDLAEALESTVPDGARSWWRLAEQVLWLGDWYLLGLESFGLAVTLGVECLGLSEDRHYSLVHPNGTAEWVASRVRIGERLYVSGRLARTGYPPQVVTCNGAWYLAVPARVRQAWRMAA